MNSAESTTDSAANRLKTIERAPDSGFSNRWLGPLLVVLVGTVMLAWSWQRWPDVLVDFGREVYVPWQLAEGKVLYRDIVHTQGPLSPYVNALWFRLFGPGILTLAMCNLALLVVIVTLLYRLLAAMSNRLAATIACLVFVTLFAFPQYASIANYNYLTPYRQETTHGVLLCLAAIFSLRRHLMTKTLVSCLATGLFCGLLFLTKPDIFLAGALAVAAGLGLGWWTSGLPLSRISKLAVALVAGFTFPLVLTFALFAACMPLKQAALGVLGAWPAVFDPAYAQSTFTRQGMGTDDLPTSLLLIGKWILYDVAFFGAIYLLARALKSPSRFRPVCAIALGLSIVLIAETIIVRWSQIGRPFPVFLLAIVACLLVQLWQLRGRSGEVATTILKLAFAVFAGVLLAKMLFNTRIYHYGFVLAMPATVLLVIMLVDWVPSAISRKGGYGWLFRSAALGVLAAMIVWHVKVIDLRFGNKTVAVASGRDRFVSDAKGAYVNGILRQISEQMEPGETLVTMPEGVMINYLSRRVNPTPYVDFLVTELAYFGEDKALAAFQKSPPDAIALVHWDTSEFGPKFFGRDYGQKLFGWIKSNYEQVALEGAPPLVDDRFGIALLRRKPAARH